MLFILTCKDDVFKESEAECRRRYIKEVTHIEPSLWLKRPLGKVEYWVCYIFGNDESVYFTGHDADLWEMMFSIRPGDKWKVYANSCMMLGEEIVRALSFHFYEKRGIEVLWAEQEKTVCDGRVIRINPYAELGAFGFKTTRADRYLFLTAQKKGFFHALSEVFCF